MGGRVTRGRVLCVDDEQHVLFALSWLLQREFEVHTAQNAAEALRLVATHDFDVVMADERMPATSGVELLREVRLRSPRTMRILLTGYADLEAMMQSVNEGEVYRFVTKPWDVRALPRLIATAVEAARESAEAIAAVAKATPVPATPPAPEQPAESTLPARARAPSSGASGTPRPPTPARARPAAAKTASHVPARGAEPAAAAAHAGPEKSTTERVLVLDADPRVHASIRHVLTGETRLEHAQDMTNAVRILTEKDIAILVTDVVIGKHDGTRLVRLLKQKRPNIVSLVFSTQKDAERVMDLINQGQVYRFIPKPFSPGHLRSVIQSALRHHRALLAQPALAKRHQVEPTPAGTSRKLLEDALAGTTGKPTVAAGEAEKADRPAPRAAAGGEDPKAAASGAAAPVSATALRRGFRKLFGE